MEVAEEYIRRASRQRTDGELESAFNGYQVALATYLDLYKHETDARRKTQLGGLIEVRNNM
jgi:hypothetical protein